jgi:formate dehydrogenase subunit gamma
LFLITGLLMWFDDVVPRWVVAVSYVDSRPRRAGDAGAFIIHVYEGTAHQPGTFRSMIDGTVSEKWAWTHHPAGIRSVTGRDPRSLRTREATPRRAERERGARR